VRTYADGLQVGVALVKSGTDGDLRVSAEISRNGQGLAAMISSGNPLRAAWGLRTDSSAGPGHLSLPGHGSFACTSLRRVPGALLKVAYEEAGGMSA
jgi:hypothetical protein